VRAQPQPTHHACARPRAAAEALHRRRGAERLAHELDGEVAVAAGDVTANRFTLSRFAEPGLVRGYPTLLLFRCVAATAAQSALRCD